MRRKRQSEAPEESAIRKKKDRESRRLRRAVSTQKEKMMERISKSQSKLETRLSETKKRTEERRSSLQALPSLKDHRKPRNKALRESHTIQPDIGKTMRRMQQRPKTHLEFNSALALASMGAQVEEFRGYGPYSYKIHGQIYHAAGLLHPPTGKAPSYGQSYIMDTKQTAEERHSVAPNKNCDRSIMKSLSKLLAEINAFAKSYKCFHSDVVQRGPRREHGDCRDTDDETVLRHDGARVRRLWRRREGE
uniref:Uncharacterized protein n=1 Tax=Caenorhabditis japonica TaxID=281687 RepID=A0A8R1EGL6_CAEJA